MKPLIPNLLGILLMFFIFSCQKEGSLESGSGGNNLPGNSTDLLPLSQNSWWSYIDPAFSDDDSITLHNVKTGQVAGKTYHFIQFVYEDDVLDTIYYRKSGNDYFEYMPVDKYSYTIFDTEIKAEILFLKEGMKNGDTWTSSEFTNSIGGVPARLRYEFTCTGANGSATIGGKTYNGVYTISFKPQFSIQSSIFLDDIVAYEILYAKGIGMISFKEIVNGASTLMTIKGWKIF